MKHGLCNLRIRGSHTTCAHVQVETSLGIDRFNMIMQVSLLLDGTAVVGQWLSLCACPCSMPRPAADPVPLAMPAGRAAAQGDGGYAADSGAAQRAGVHAGVRGRTCVLGCWPTEPDQLGQALKGSRGKSSHTRASHSLCAFQ